MELQLAPLGRAIVESDQEEVLTLLLNHGANVAFTASTSGHSLVVSALVAEWLGEGCDPDDFTWESVNRNVPIVLQRLSSLQISPEQGLGTDAVPFIIRTFLIWIKVWHTEAEVVDALDPMMTLIDTLVGFGADINSVEREFGNTALHEVVLCQSFMSNSIDLSKFLRFLLERGANVNTKDRLDRNVLSCAMDMTRIPWRLIKPLVEFGADLGGYQDDLGNTALHRLAQCDETAVEDMDKPAMIEMLLRSGVSDHARNNREEAALL